MKCFSGIIEEILCLSKVLCEEEFNASLFECYSIKIKALSDLLKNQNLESVKKNLQLQILEPFFLHLRNARNSTHKCILIECLTHALKFTEVNDVIIFFRLYLLIFVQVFDSNQLNPSVPEELKTVVLETGGCLIKNSTQHVLANVYVQEYGEKFSIGISASVKFAKEEKSFKLRKAALEFLLLASQFYQQEDYNSKLYKQVGDLFILYLPGIIAPLQEFILRGEIQHHVLTIKALSCWGHILCLTLNDFSSDEEVPECEILKNWMHSSQEPLKEVHKIVNINKTLMEKKKTKEWLAAATNTLGPLIVKITEIRKHSNPKCRLELVKVIAKLLENCAVNLETFLYPVVEVLVSCSFDENEEVCLVAKDSFSKFAKKCKENKFKKFNTIIENNLFQLLNKLPRIVTLKNEETLLLSLKSFSGYLRILGQSGRLKQLLCFSSSLKKLMLVLQICVKLEIYSEISNQEFSVWDDDYCSSTKWMKPWKHFQFFEDPLIKQELEGICRLLGQFGEPESIIDCLLQFYNNDQNSKKEILIILNQVVLGVHMQNHIVNRLIDFYLNSENFCLPIEIDGEDCLNVKEVRCNIIMVALTLEGIGNLTENIHDHVQNHLLRILYCVVEHIGSAFSVIKTEVENSESSTNLEMQMMNTKSNCWALSCKLESVVMHYFFILIETSTEFTLKTGIAISKACGYNGNIYFLLKSNIDYLTYHLTVKLRKNNMKALDVMTVVINNSSLETLFNLEDTIRNVLQISSRNFYSPFTISYLRVLQTFVSSIGKWVRPEEAKLNDLNNEKKEVDELLSYLNSRQKGMEQAEEEKDSAKRLDTEEYEEVLKESENTKCPWHIGLVVSISNHCLHFLASKDKNKNLIVLEILNESVFILAKWENYLLPIVHKIWSLLATKFEQRTDPLIINRSFTLLCNLARTSKNFIRSRTLKNILPALLSFLSSEARHSKLKTISSGYYFSQNYKLQSELLKNIGLLATNLGLFERQLDLVIESLLLYLDSLQPKELQELCLELFLHLKEYDLYLVWLKLQNLSDNDLEYVKNKNIVLNNRPENVSSKGKDG